MSRLGGRGLIVETPSVLGRCSDLALSLSYIRSAFMMYNAQTVRMITALIIFFGHIWNMCLLPFFWIRGGYSFDEMITVFAIISPLFAAYLTVVVNYAYSETAVSSEERTPFLAAMFSISFPTLFMLMMTGAITAKAFRLGIGDMDQLVKLIGVIETVIGSYVTIVTKRIFSP
jgi:hypothetical protein